MELVICQLVAFRYGYDAFHKGRSLEPVYIQPGFIPDNSDDSDLCSLGNMGGEAFLFDMFNNPVKTVLPGTLF